MKKPTILIADDQPIVAAGLESLLAAEFDVVGVVSDGRELVSAARKLRPQVIVSDVAMPHLNGLDALPLLQDDNKSVKVVFLTMHTDIGYARRAIEAGASGFILKHSAPCELNLAIHAALDGKTFITPEIASGVLQAMRKPASKAWEDMMKLTPRQKEILQLVAEGSSAKEIADQLKISSRTVEFHKYQMMDSLHVESTAGLIRFAIRHGVVRA